MPKLPEKQLFLVPLPVPILLSSLTLRFYPKTAVPLLPMLLPQSLLAPLTLWTSLSVG